MGKHGSPSSKLLNWWTASLLAPIDYTTVVDIDATVKVVYHRPIAYA